MPEAAFVETPQPTQTNWPKIILAAVLGLALLASAAYAGYWYGTESSNLKSQISKPQLKTQVPETPTLISVFPTSIPTFSETANWKTYTNDVYSYTINYPPSFKIGLCKDCNPPEIGVGLENDDKTISISIEYAHQFTLCANSPSPCISTKNLKINIMGKKYTHEEYYIDYYKRYIFKIEDIERNRQFSQISISGAYNNVSDAKLIDQVLSTFKFLD